MATTYKTTFQLRRGLAEVWKKNNPLLAKGEPGFELDTNRLKIGDGEKNYNDLPYIGEAEVFNADSKAEFPSIGRVNTIYKAEKEQALYQWNPDLNDDGVGGYELVSGGSPALDIQIINGGSANVN